MMVSDHLDAAHHQRAARDIAPDLWPRLTLHDAWIAALVAVGTISLAALPFVAAIATLPLPVKS